MMINTVENVVMGWYEKTDNTKPLFATNKLVLTLEISVSTGKYPWTREMGDGIMEGYFQGFNTHYINFNFLSC